MNAHYSRDKGILAAQDYLGMHVDPLPMIRLPKRKSMRPEPVKASGRIAAFVWLICCVFGRD